MYMIQAECEFIRLVFISSHLIFIYYLIFYYIHPAFYYIFWDVCIYTILYFLQLKYNIYDSLRSYQQFHPIFKLFIHNYVHKLVDILFFPHLLISKVWIFHIYPHLLVNLIVDNWCFTWNIFAVLWIKIFWC